ncbi:hypothetical protein A1D30_21670 [Acidovorax sp. GW101-3H11]|nr:hypothetical protein A1D30_21670 [Acidovorax sp. GW101-3H11]
MRAVVGRVLFCGLLLACRLGLHGVEELVQILAVVDETHALVDAGEVGRPVGLPGAALYADVGHGFLLGEAAFHFRRSISQRWLACEWAASRVGKPLLIEPMTSLQQDELKSQFSSQT